ncbi:hypothetical protein WAI453_001892 [Rhynchosporium graminicola]
MKLSVYHSPSPTQSQSSTSHPAIFAGTTSPVQNPRARLLTALADHNHANPFMYQIKIPSSISVAQVVGGSQPVWSSWYGGSIGHTPYHRSDKHEFDNELQIIRKGFLRRHPKIDWAVF